MKGRINRDLLSLNKENNVLFSDSFFFGRRKRHEAFSEANEENQSSNSEYQRKKTNKEVEAC